MDPLSLLPNLYPVQAMLTGQIVKCQDLVNVCPIDNHSNGIYHGGLHMACSYRAIGQVAQLVEHGPEKAGVRGSSPRLSTAKNPCRLSLFADRPKLGVRLTFSEVYPMGYVWKGNRNAY
jgi:hypothetical protein